jgi:hypothetical protein
MPFLAAGGYPYGPRSPGAGASTIAAGTTATAAAIVAGSCFAPTAEKPQSSSEFSSSLAVRAGDGALGGDETRERRRDSSTLLLRHERTAVSAAWLEPAGGGFRSPRPRQERFGPRAVVARLVPSESGARTGDGGGVAVGVEAEAAEDGVLHAGGEQGVGDRPAGSVGMPVLIEHRFGRSGCYVTPRFSAPLLAGRCRHGARRPVGYRQWDLIAVHSTGARRQWCCRNSVATVASVGTDASTGTPRVLETMTHTPPPPSASRPSVFPTGIVSVTRFVRGSMRDTVPVCVLATHTASAPYATSLTPGASGMVRSTGWV